MIRAPYIIFFVFAICCSFRHNAAIPLASHSAVTNQMQDISKEKKTDSQNNWNDTILQSYPTRETELSDTVSGRNSATKTHNVNYRGSQKKKTVNNNQNQRVIQNLNLNINDFRPEYDNFYRPKQGDKEDSAIHNLEDIIKKEYLVNCTSDKKKIQRYSRSFVENSTNYDLSVDKEFAKVVGKNSKTKRTSSVHEDEDITLCWIETMTIKDDRTFQPPKRLVIREYTISFENSATIPDRYLECKRLEGELVMNDPEIGKTALFEVIDEDTKVSKVINFTSISHIGDITVWQHKRVKCGVGPVVSKNIMEWNDGSDNPKKRVEIKISPKMHKLMTKNEEEPCTESSEGPEIEKSSTSTGDMSHVTDITKSCKDTESGICEMTTRSDDVSTSYLETSTTDKAVTELPKSETSSENGSEEDSNLSVSVTESSSGEKGISTESPITTERLFTTTIKSDELLPSKKDVLDCENSSDPACAVRHVTNVFPTSLSELSTELSATSETNVQTETSSTTSMGIMTTSVPTSQEVITEVATETELSSQKKPLFTTESSKSIEENTSEAISDLATVETSLFPFTTVSEYDGGVSMKTSESTRRPTVETTTTIIESLDYDHGSTTTTILEADVTTSPSVIKAKKEEEHLTDKEISSSVSKESMEDYDTTSPVESTSKSDKVHYVPPLDKSTITSGEIDITQDVTTAIPLSIEFVQEPEKSSKILDKLFTSISTEGITTESASMKSTAIESSSIENAATEFLSIETTATNFLSTSKEISVEESEENLTHKIEETTTIRPKVAVEEFISTEISPVTASKISEIEPITLSSTTSNQFDYMCENSEDCTYTSSSEDCDESGDCGSTTESCESGVCSEEQSVENELISDVTSPSTMKIQTPTIELQSTEEPMAPMASEVQQQLTSTTVATSISEEGDNSMTIDNISTTVETRRSTPLSSMTTTTPRHKLILKIKVLLEHVNEKKEKENLVEVEKQLLLDENTEHHKHPDLLKQLKSFNDSINMQAISALLNCTSLGNLTNNVNLMNNQVNHNINSKSEELQFIYPKDLNSQQSSTSEQAKFEDSQYSEFDQEYEMESRKRRRRDFADNKEDILLNTFRKNLFDPLSDLVNLTNTLNANSMKESIRSRDKLEQKANNSANGNEKNEIKSMPAKSDIEKTKMEIVKQALPEVVKDFSIGLQNIMSQLTQHLAHDPKKVKINLLDIIADPKDNRFHSRRKRAATKEVGHWSNEKIRKAPMGGNLRSFTEFVLYDILS